MSTASRHTQHATRVTLEAKASTLITKGMPVKFTTSARTVEHAGASDDVQIGIAGNTVTATDTDRDVNVYLPGPVVPVLVGTGGATQGTKAKIVSDGFTNAGAHDSSGATDDSIAGVFFETGVVGDIVGMIPLLSNRGAA